MFGFTRYEIVNGSGYRKPESRTSIIFDITKACSPFLVAKVGRFELEWHFVNALSNLQLNQHKPLHNAN